MKLLATLAFAVMIGVSLVGVTFAAPSDTVSVKHDKGKKHEKKHKKPVKK